MRQKTDYSSAAVTRRLKQVDDLRRVCLMLAGPRLKWDWRKTSVVVAKTEKKRQKNCRSGR